MATDNTENGRDPATVFSWLDPHPLFVIVIVGEDEETFGIQKDFLVAKSAYFRKYFAGKKPEQVEDIVRLPDADPIVFALAQLFMFTGTITTTPQPLPGYDLLIEVWKLGNELGIDGLCEEALNAMSEYRAATNSIPATDLLVKAWNETPEGSPIRALLLSWTAEYIRSSESRAEFTKSLPQEVLSELVVVMSHLNAAPTMHAKRPSSPSAQQKSVHYLDHEGDEREIKATKHRHSEGAQNRVKKTTSRPSLSTTPKTYKTKRGSSNIGDESQVSSDSKLNFCSDLLNRMLSGPGFWTRLVGPFREPVRPTEDGVPNYFEKVKRPMDLSTIKKKMDRGEYNTAEEFEADVRQIFENCYTYWGPGHDMTAAAERFQKSFEEKYGEMFKWISKNTEGSETA